MEELKKRRSDTLSKVLKVLVLIVFGIPGVVGVIVIAVGLFTLLRFQSLD